VIRILLFLGAVACYGQQLVFTPFHNSGIYEISEKIGWTVTADGTAGPYTYAIRKNNRETIQSGSLEFAEGIAVIQAQVDEPSMIYVEVSGGANARPVHLGAAVAPAKLKPSVPRPDDFDAFWQGKLQALNQIPVSPELTSITALKPGVDFFTVKLASVDSHVQGYQAKPAKEGKFPALVIYQAAGVKALDAKTVNDRASEGWLVFSVDSHDMAPDVATGVSTSYASIGNTNRETCYFLDMYLRDARAIDYIRSRPDWDGKTLVLMGTSMGGQQSLVTAGLRPEVTAVLVNEPAGADLNGDLHGRKSGYPNWPSDNAEVMATATYFDPVNFAPLIKAPVLAAIGFIDTTSPPAGIFTALNQIPGGKEAICMIESDHNNRTPEKQGTWVARSKEVLGILVKGGEFRPRVMGM
jgi:cephalosporin-C deacetylase-like acetyl esterase